MAKYREIVHRINHEAYNVKNNIQIKSLQDDRTGHAYSPDMNIEAIVRFTPRRKDNEQMAKDMLVNFIDKLVADEIKAIRELNGMTDDDK